MPGFCFRRGWIQASAQQRSLSPQWLLGGLCSHSPRHCLPTQGKGLSSLGPLNQHPWGCHVLLHELTTS